MKKILIVTISLIFLVLLVSSSFGEFHGLWKNKKLAKEIGLSEEQIDKMKDLSIATEKKMIKIRADMELKEIDLREVLDADKPDEGKAINLIKEIMKKKTEAWVLKIKQRIAMKKTLTTEQMEKLEEFKREHRMRKEHKCKKECKKEGSMHHEHHEGKMKH
ncbi:MAG: periplasmic heavy metal sensor [Candidatus Cloacimonadota bacterium]|nr:MAG: periplasmic heavy metal sensor [Candidatus Cloacimonadota bacterium]